MSEHIADYLDCLELAGQIADAVQCYDSDDLTEVITPHLKPVIGELKFLRNALANRDPSKLAELEAAVEDLLNCKVMEMGMAEDCLRKALAAFRREA